MVAIFDRIIWEEDGQGLVEYGLTIFLIAIVLAGALSQVQISLSSIYVRILEIINETSQGTTVSSSN